MMKQRVAIIEKHGPPDVLTVVERELPPPGFNEVRLRQTAIGFNYLDVKQREGKVYAPPLPTALGHEAAGVIEQLGEGVTAWKPGDRVAYMNAGIGAYASHRNVSADKLVALPDTVSDEAAATLLFKGLTAQYLIRRTHAVKPGDLLLVHSAAGGVGQILARWATALEATVVGTTGSPHKREAVLAAGCASAIDLTDPDWPSAFLQATGGRKAHVVYDAIGKDTFLQSLDCIDSFGLMVSYGSASGDPPPVDVGLLNQKGCLFLTRPSVFPHNATTAQLQANAADLFDAIDRGFVKADIGQRFRLDDIVQVHTAAQERRVAGAIVIVP
jgi:NADPH2:quinone reductase